MAIAIEILEVIASALVGAVGAALAGAVATLLEAYSDSKRANPTHELSFRQSLRALLTL